MKKDDPFKPIEIVVGLDTAKELLSHLESWLEDNEPDENIDDPWFEYQHSHISKAEKAVRRIVEQEQEQPQ